MYIDRGYYKCHGGSCEFYESNPLMILTFILNCSMVEALHWVVETYRPQFIPARAQSKLEAEQLQQDAKREIFAASHDYMCAALDDPTNSRFASVAPGLNWLINERKIDKEVLHALPVGLVPEAALLAKQIQVRYSKELKAWQAAKHLGKDVREPRRLYEPALEYIRGIFQDPDFVGSVLFPLHVSPTEIGRLKFRVPQDDKKFLMPDDDFEDLLGLYGVGWPMHHNFLGTDPKHNFAYLVEGEMDALSMMAHYVVKGTVSFPVFSIGGRGGSKYVETILQALGLSRAYLVGDAPHKQGNEIVQAWMEHTRDVSFKIFTGWDRLVGAGDVDEAIKDLGGDKTVEVLWDQREETFLPPWKWAYDRAAEDLVGVTDDDYRELMEVAAVHGKYLLHPVEREKYLEEIAADYSLNPLLLKRQISAQDNTELGFMRSCTETLRDLFSVIGMDRNENGQRVLLLYNKNNKNFEPVRLANMAETESLLAPIGGNLVSFVQEHIGEPPFLDFPDPKFPEKQVLPKLIPALKLYLTSALSDLAQEVPDIAHNVRYSQGYHKILIDGAPEEFIVCGKDIVHIDRENIQPCYKELSEPIYKNAIFDTGITSIEKGREWYPGGAATSILQDVVGTDLNELYDRLTRLYTEAFRFKNHELTAQLIAALVMVFPIMSAFSHPIVSFLTGDSSSGKSSLLSTLVQVGTKSSMRLLFSSMYQQTYTASAVGRMADGMTNLMVFDEFEWGDDQRGMAVRQILEFFRGIITGGGDRILSEGSKGVRRESYKLPVIFAAIRTPEREQDLNRMLLIETERVPDKEGPELWFNRNFPPELAQRIIKQLNFGMYPHALELSQIEKDLVTAIPSLQRELRVRMDWRFATNLCPPLAVMKFLGRDWKQFLSDYVRSNKFEIIRISAVSETESRVKEIMHSPAILTDPREPRTSLAKLLISPDQRDLINVTGNGVYYDEETNYLLILASQGASLVPQHRRVGLSGPQLKSLLDRHPAAISPGRVVSCGILRRAAPFLGANIHLQDAIVLDASRWLNLSEIEVKTEETQYGTNERIDTPAEPERPIEVSITSREEGEEEKEEKEEDSTESEDFSWNG